MADKKRRPPTGLRIPYFGQRRSLASARLEMLGSPVDMNKGIMQHMGRLDITNNIERESIKL